jgi:hypothetical protein
LKSAVAVTLFLKQLYENQGHTFIEKRKIPASFRLVRNPSAAVEKIPGKPE